MESRFHILLWTLFSYHVWHSTKPLQIPDVYKLEANQSTAPTAPNNPASTYYTAQRISVSFS